MEVFLREIVRMPEYEPSDYRQLPVWQTRISLAPTIAREMVLTNYRWEPERFVARRVPTLLLLGGDSAPYARQAAELVHAALPASQIVVLPGQQHIAMDTDPALFAREARRFLLE